MGRFSPQVPFTPNVAFANALTSGANSFMQAREMKQRSNDSDRAFDAQMLQHGYHPTTAGEEAAANAPHLGNVGVSAGGPDSMGMADALTDNSVRPTVTNLGHKDYTYDPGPMLAEREAMARALYAPHAEQQQWHDQYNTEVRDPQKAAFADALVDHRANAQMPLIQARGDIQTNIADSRNAQSNTNNIRSTTTSANNHATPSGSAVYNHNNRTAGGGAGPNPVTGPRAVTTALGRQITNTRADLNAARKSPPNLNAMQRQGQDTTGVMGRFRSDTTVLHNRLNSLNTQMDGATTNLTRAATGGARNFVSPDAGSPDIDRAQAYESLRDQGMSHEDALNMIMSGSGQ